MKKAQIIKAWSHSRLGVFETCKKRAKLQYIDRIPEPDRGPPPKGEWANDRGNRVHDAAEDYIKSNRDDIIIELTNFAPELRRVREMYTQGKVEGEQMWYFDSAWGVVSGDVYEDIWLRIKLDLLVNITNTEAVVIDYKTGRRSGNEIKHAEQCQLYQVGAFLRYPKLEKVTTELWYTDQDEIATMTFTRKQGERFLSGFNIRGLEITTATDFPSNPNAYSCKWCPYSPSRSDKGHCPEGV